MRTITRQEGFTLPELIATAGLFFVILVLLFVFVHPRDYTIQNRNAERWLAISEMMQALNAYHLEYGKLPDGLSESAQQISNSSEDAIDLCPALVPEFLTDLPVDPRTGLQLPDGACIGSKDDPSAYAYSSQYSIKRAKDGTVTITADGAELKQHISISHKY